MGNKNNWDAIFGVVVVILICSGRGINCCSGGKPTESEEAEPEGNEPDEIIRGPATDRITIGQDKTVKCDKNEEICAELSPGEHCQSGDKCKCGSGSSCIGTVNPRCHEGKCKACSSPNVQCMAKDTKVEICVPKELKCDGTYHCQDGSDEQGCAGSSNCGVGEFACNDGTQCIPRKKECDKKEDCKDGSDEIMECDFGFPTFAAIACNAHEVSEPSYDFCVKVVFSNDNETDYLLLNEDEAFKYNFLYEGKLKKEGVMVDVALADKEEDPPETYTTIAFHSQHVHTCTHFSAVDLKPKNRNKIQSDCIVHAETVGFESGNDFAGFPLSKGEDFSLTGYQQKTLNPNGYILNTVVYYDDMLLQQYGNSKEKVNGKLRAVMAFVKELYSEKDTLKTVIKVNVLAIEHASGKNWGTTKWRFPLNNLKPIAQNSPHKGEIYVFITGTKSLSGLGLANCIGCLCDADMPARSITKYGFQGKADKLLFTAEIVAHEMGHNLGMWHDCVQNNQYICSRNSKPRREDGKDCYGYMDYDPKTNKWSHCNVNDLRKANKDCLKKIDGNDDDSGGTEVSCPSTYRYAFKRGKFCCRANKDNNGGTLTINSNSCQFDAYRPCPGAKCKNYEGSGGGTVNCGNHRAPSCKECPQGQGPTHCSGDCKWDWDSFSCQGTGGTSPSTCTNIQPDAHCNFWERQGFCTRSHAKYMLKNCKKACKKC